MRFARSTTFRFAALVFLLQIAGAALLLITVHQLTQDQIDDEAQIEAEYLRDTLLPVYRSQGFVHLRDRVAEGATPGRMPGSVLLLVDRAGRPVAGNLAEWPASLAPVPGTTTIELYRVGREDSEPMRLIVTPLRGGGRLLTGHVIESEIRFTIVLEEAMGSALAVAVALALFAAWSSARLIHRKLEATVATAEGVASGDLEHRVTTDDSGDAFDSLGHAVNHMLERIAGLMTELKIATDGLAHDLRSPLTRLRSTLERALDASESEEARSGVARAIEEGDRLLTMLDTALRISRAEAGLGREAFVETDLSAMVEDMAEVYGPLAEDKGFTIEAEASTDISGHVHRELLGQAIANLIDNALKYGAGRIRVSARRDATGALVIAVGDDGPGISEEQRPEAVRRFGRLDSARTQTGAGLGLSLAAAVARLHGGALTLEDNAPGLRVELHLMIGADEATV